MSLLGQIIMVCLLSGVVGYAAASFRLASGSLLLKKRVSELASEQQILAAESEKLMVLVKKLSNRQALADHRHKANGKGLSDGADPPAAGDKKAAKAYYLNGKSHADIARMAMNGGK